MDWSGCGSFRLVLPVMTVAAAVDKLHAGYKMRTYCCIEPLQCVYRGAAFLVHIMPLCFRFLASISIFVFFYSHWIGFFSCGLLPTNAIRRGERVYHTHTCPFITYECAQRTCMKITSNSNCSYRQSTQKLTLNTWSDLYLFLFVFLCLPNNNNNNNVRNILRG